MRTCITALAAVLIMVATGVLPAQPPREGRGLGQRSGRGAEQREAMRAGRGALGPPSIALLEALDADQDGVLSAEEVANAVAALKKLDTNNDGKLSQDEIGWPPRPQGRGAIGGPDGGSGAGGPGGRGFGAGGPVGPAAGGVPGGGLDLAARIMSYDKNQDGKVTRDELPEFMQRMLARADSNQDGAIDPAEAKAVSEAFGRGGFGRGRGAGRGAGF